MELLTLLTLVTSAVATFWGGCCNSGTYSPGSYSPMYSYYSPTSSFVPTNDAIYSFYSTSSLPLQSSVPSGARIVSVSSPATSFEASDARIVSVSQPTYSYVPSGARIVSVSSPTTSYVPSGARIVSVSSPTSSFVPSDTRIVSVSSPTNSFVSSGARIVSFSSPTTSSVLSGSPVYSLYSSNSPTTTIWYPGAIDYANRRLLQYVNGQDGRGQYDNYPPRNRLFVRLSNRVQRRRARNAQATVKSAHRPASATEVPPLVEPTGPPQGLVSDIESEENFHREKVGPARPSATSAEDKPPEETVTRVLPPSSAAPMPSQAKPAGPPQGLISETEEVSHGNAQVERKGPSPPDGSSTHVVPPSIPPDFRRLRLPGEDDEPSDRERRKHLRKRLH